ncbi:MAG: YARHG domain-containing protein [Bacteroidia bacterium]
MNRTIIPILFLTLVLIQSCKNPVKNKVEVIVENGTKVEGTKPKTESNETNNLTIKKEASEPIKDYKIEAESINLKYTQNADSSTDPIGYWVGFFERAGKKSDYGKAVYVDEGYMWNRENKINISVDSIIDTLAYGHSVVAGNHRPFKGMVKKTDIGLEFKVREPGDDKYDGEFIFIIANGHCEGSWNAFGDIDITSRVYSLEKKKYKYNPDIQIEKPAMNTMARRFVDWNSYNEWEVSYAEEFEDAFEEEFDETWIEREFASATNDIYKVNASNTLLEKEQVENEQVENEQLVPQQPRKRCIIC